MANPGSPSLSPSFSLSRSRRSYPNLHNLSLAPLSAKYSLDTSPSPSPSESHTPTTSYMAQKSAPATPGILSLAHSREDSRQFSSKTYAYHGHFFHPEATVGNAGDLPKAKSTSTLQNGITGFARPARGQESQYHTQKQTAPTLVLVPAAKHRTTEGRDEWFHRAGLAIVRQTRDSKGQGWLVRKESSTSLVQDNYDDQMAADIDSRHMALLSGERVEQACAPSLASPRVSQAGSRLPSRLHSRVPSARTSRRGSRTGSRADLIMSAGLGSHATHPDLDSLELHDPFIEPDFVQSMDGEDGEEEIARLARERGFGLGSWMDRLIGWTLFDVDEDEESSEEEEEEEEEEEGEGDGEEEGHLRWENFTREEVRLRREVEAKRRKMEREAIIASSALTGHQWRNDSPKKDESRPTTAAGQGQSMTEEAGGWQDAAWLLSVASKALLS